MIRKKWPCSGLFSFVFHATYKIQIIFHVIIVVLTFKIQLLQIPRSHYRMLHQRKRKRFSRITGNSSTISRIDVKHKLQTFFLSFIVVIHLFKHYLCAEIFPQGSDSRITNIWRGLKNWVLPILIFSLCAGHLIAHCKISKRTNTLGKEGKEQTR